MSEEKKRVTAHNGRKGKDGVFNPKHNDRNFDVTKSDHIDPTKVGNNLYWHCYQESDPEMTFEDTEALFYEEHCREILDVKNQACIDARHPERVKTMDDYRRSIKTCPEEQILEIGKKGNSVDTETLLEIVSEQIEWEKETFPNFVVLDVAVHADEPNIAIHMHKRGAWLAHDEETGLETINQTKALQEMGIEAPHPEKKISRYNNPKVTYTRLCREHLLQLCKEHGVEVETEPKKASKSGLEFEEYKRQQIREKAEKEAKAIREAAERDAAEIRNRTDFMKGYETAQRDTKKALAEGKLVSGEEYNRVVNKLKTTEKNLSKLTQEYNELALNKGEKPIELDLEQE